MGPSPRPRVETTRPPVTTQATPSVRLPLRVALARPLTTEPRGLRTGLAARASVVVGRKGPLAGGASPVVAGSGVAVPRQPTLLTLVASAITLPIEAVGRPDPASVGRAARPELRAASTATPLRLGPKLATKRLVRPARALQEAGSAVLARQARDEATAFGVTTRGVEVAGVAWVMDERAPDGAA